MIIQRTLQPVPDRNVHRTYGADPSDLHWIARCVWFAGGTESAVADFMLTETFGEAWRTERADRILLLAAARATEPPRLAVVGGLWLDHALATFGDQTDPRALDSLHDTIATIAATAGRITKATTHLLIDRLGRDQAGRIDTCTLALILSACATIEITVRPVPFLTGAACEVVGGNICVAAEHARGVDVAAFERELVAIAKAHIDPPIPLTDELNTPEAQ